MSNICFTVLHYKTPFFYALSIELENRGHSVYFLCPSPKWKYWLLAQGINEHKILDQTLAVRSDPLSKEELANFAEIEEFERNNDITINSMIMMDRLLKDWPPEGARNYLIRLFPLLKNFLIQKQIDVVIGEATPANELLTESLCSWIGIPYYFPITIRVPDDRFAFFKGRLQFEFEPIKAISQKDLCGARKWAAEYASFFNKKQPKPSYWHKNNKLPKVHLAWIIKFFRTLRDEINYKNCDPTRYPLSWLLKKRVKEVINRYTIHRISFSKENTNQEKFILYPLHKQPESSVDVLGDFYSDQLNLIKQICRSMPVGYFLYVKEHSNAVGDRALSFYREIERLPNTKLISPYIDSFLLLRQAAVVISISGTMAYEAGLIGKPAITFSKMFFCKLPSVQYCHEIRKLPALLERQLNYQPESDWESKRADFLVNIYLNSFSGTFADVHSYPEVIAPDNVRKVCDAIGAVI